MPLLGLLNSLSQYGPLQGAENYIGNQTGFGQDINTAGNIFQSADGQPKSQLIGQPAQGQQNQIGAPQLTDEHLEQPNGQGVRMFNQAGKQYLLKFLGL
jgi:hypothetical protein